MPQQETYSFLLGFVFAFWTQESFRVPPILQEVQTFSVFIDISVRVCVVGGIAWGSRVKTKKKKKSGFPQSYVRSTSSLPVP